MVAKGYLVRLEKIKGICGKMSVCDDQSGMRSGWKRYFLHETVPNKLCGLSWVQKCIVCNWESTNISTVNIARTIWMNNRPTGKRWKMYVWSAVNCSVQTPVTFDAHNVWKQHYILQFKWIFHGPDRSVWIDFCCCCLRALLFLSMFPCSSPASLHTWPASASLALPCCQCVSGPSASFFIPLTWTSTNCTSSVLFVCKSSFQSLWAFLVCEVPFCYCQ